MRSGESTNQKIWNGIPRTSSVCLSSLAKGEKRLGIWHSAIDWDKQPCKNVLWKASFTARTTSVSNRFRSPSQRSWLTKKLFPIAFASVHPIIICTFHCYYNHIIEINNFSIYIGWKVLIFLPRRESPIREDVVIEHLSSRIREDTYYFKKRRITRGKS